MLLTYVYKSYVHKYSFKKIYLQQIKKEDG